MLKLRPLIIGEAERQKILNLKSYAIDNPVNLETMIQIKNGNVPPVGDYSQYCICIPKGFKIVYSIEQHPGGWFKHISISVNAKKYPSEEHILAILDKFDFDDVNSPNVMVYQEHMARAINVVQKIN